MPNFCHPDCGPITAHNEEDRQHCHTDNNGDCWHDDIEGFDANAAKQYETLINYVRNALDKLDDPELEDRERDIVRDELLDLADFHGGQTAKEIGDAGLPV